MANQLKMADIQAILALHQRGWSDRRIARELDIHRETVGHYVRLSKAGDVNLSQQVQALITAGTLKQAQANSLLVKLTNVLNSGGSGRIGAFINEVEALIKSRRLSAADGQLLISLADVLLGSLS